MLLFEHRAKSLTAGLDPDDSLANFLDREFECGELGGLNLKIYHKHKLARYRIRRDRNDRKDPSSAAMRMAAARWNIVSSPDQW